MSAALLSAVQDVAIARVRTLEAELLKLPQVDLPTEHFLHAGLYVRTMFLPAGVVATGAHIRLATTLIVSGHVTLFTGEDDVELDGYHVLQAAAGRKTACLAHADSHITMLFATDVETLDAAEEAFTIEPERLATRSRPHCLTGGMSCLGTYPPPSP